MQPYRGPPIPRPPGYYYAPAAYGGGGLGAGDGSGGDPNQPAGPPPMHPQPPPFFGPPPTFNGGVAQGGPGGSPIAMGVQVDAAAAAAQSVTASFGPIRHHGPQTYKHVNPYQRGVSLKSRGVGHMTMHAKRIDPSGSVRARKESTQSYPAGG